MTQLTITHDDLKRLCAIEPTDTDSDADLDAVLAAEQPVCEYALDPVALLASSADAGLRATLTLGVAEILAGGFLRQQARAWGATDDFKIGPLDVTASRADSLPQMGERLTAQGVKRLEPFARAAKRVASDALGLLTPDGSGKTPLLAQATIADSVFDRPSPFGGPSPSGAAGCDEVTP